MKRPSGVADVAWYDIERAITARDAEHRAASVMAAALIERLRGELGEAKRLLGAMPKTVCYRFGPVPGGPLVKDCGTCLSCRRAKLLAAPPPAESTPVQATSDCRPPLCCDTACRWYNTRHRGDHAAPADDMWERPLTTRERLLDHERRLAALEAKGEPGTHPKGATP